MSVLRSIHVDIIEHSPGDFEGTVTFTTVVGETEVRTIDARNEKQLMEDVALKTPKMIRYIKEKGLRSGPSS